MLKWKQIPLGPLQTNCYLVIQNDRTCLIIDPGEEAHKLISIIEEEQLIPKAILLTHAHFDHIGAVKEMKERYGLKVYIHDNESEWLTNPHLNGSQFFMIGKPVVSEPADVLIQNEQEMVIDDFEFNVLETPGHSPGSISFYFKKSDFVVSGDALFNRSIGRTDLPGGDHAQLIKSIHEKLLILPEETVILPGHGNLTTIGEEMDSNPFLNGF